MEIKRQDKEIKDLKKINTHGRLTEKSEFTP